MNKLMLFLALGIVACNTSKHEATQKNAKTESDKVQEVKEIPNQHEVLLKKQDDDVPKDIALSPEQKESILNLEIEVVEEEIRYYSVQPSALKTTGSPHQIMSNESYRRIQENTFKHTALEPLATFSIDVDKASYSTMRRMINRGQTVPKDAIKIEELINYFDYEYKQPHGIHPFAMQTEVGPTPWNKQSKLVHIGLQGETIHQEEFPASNLVLLLDVSGSMNQENKLPLLKKSFKLLINQLRAKDHVAIVVYAGAAGVVLPPTAGDNKQAILEALNNLNAGGSTAGGAGIELAYNLAQEHFVKGGNNRIILATDGDFNVGPSSDRAMESLIEEKRTSGIYLTCLGFGMGNYKDAKLAILAEKGNGNHGYIDSMQEANNMFGKEFGGTLYTIAKDVKIQVEFNPNKVQAYRLIGYENRKLNNEDFKDDTKDAGELGSGHTVTALFEIIPVGVSSDFVKDVDHLKYTQQKNTNSFTDELLTVKCRYKTPEGTKSNELITVLKDDSSSVSTAHKFSSAVAMFGMYLRNSEYLNGTSKNAIIELAKSNKGEDRHGYRAEFIRLMESYTD
jgi:Ca-activated chloride channel family protein